MSVYEASVTSEFTAGHSLRLPTGEDEPEHSHQWQVTAAFRAEKLEGSMDVVVDFVAVLDALKHVIAPLDGQCLNETAAFADIAPSAERVAEYVAGALAAELGQDVAKLYRVEVTEAPGCTAAFYPGGATA